ncbi:MAG: sigma-54-dependent Fis family transcriptional regulator [Oleiphilaceae bacterium]|nr:sigma-54-dependent Fis family transcriptional regulator [Oleiphilaceae bacterium]
MQHVLSQIERVAPTSATVLITGETGTGKEVAATAIHRLSDRAQGPFVPVNCGAISPQLIESELFGHEKGSFTGASREHRGLFEQADGGTLFLDEITEMPVDLQVKLLRTLETRRFVRLGSEHERQANVRIIAATNRNPEEEVEAGKLRADLLYRIQVFPIFLPPLKERRDDIGSLARHFLSTLNEAEGTHKGFSPDAVEKLERHSWPGNLRELKNVIHRAYIMADQTIAEDLLLCEMAGSSSSAGPQGQTLMVGVGATLAEVERDLIFATLDHCGGRKELAAKTLGVSMKTLYNRLRKYQAEETQ